MKEIAKMRLGVLKELKNVHKFLDTMERSVKTRNPYLVQKAYVFLVHLAHEMEEGIFSPDNIDLDIEIAQLLKPTDEYL